MFADGRREDLALLAFSIALEVVDERRLIGGGGIFSPILKDGAAV